MKCYQEKEDGDTYDQYFYCINYFPGKACKKGAEEVCAMEISLELAQVPVNSCSGPFVMIIFSITLAESYLRITAVADG